MATLPNVELVLVDSAARTETLTRAMQLGVREYLSLPCAAGDVRGVIERIMNRRATAPGPKRGTNCLYSFLPARPGVGGSLLALQVALRLLIDDCHRGLLLDADLDAGMVQFLLKIQNPYSFIEAMERRARRVVAHAGHRSRKPGCLAGGRFGPRLSSRLGACATTSGFCSKAVQRNAGGPAQRDNRLSTELMRQSKAVFLVTTPEVASLQVAAVVGLPVARPSPTIIRKCRSPSSQEARCPPRSSWAASWQPWPRRFGGIPPGLSH